MAIFVNADPAIGSDANSGTSGSPYLHISRALQDVTNPNTAETIVRLQVALDEDDQVIPYTEESGYILLKGLSCYGEHAKLVIEADGWQESLYEAMKDPFSTEPVVPMDIAAAKPVQLNLQLAFIDCAEVELRGLGFNSIPADIWTQLSLQGSSRIVAKYCRFEEIAYPAILTGPVTAMFEMCYFTHHLTAILAQSGATVTLGGDNKIVDVMSHGLHALDRSAFIAKPWQYEETKAFTTTIQSTVPIKNEYNAVRLERLSALSLPGNAASEEPTFTAVLVIDNAYAKLYEKYYGVKLLSKSLLTDADQIQFTMRNTKGEVTPMTAKQRIITKAGDGTTVTQ